eukprot:1160127-Pelagomonas_calceolata.AAC.7
MERKERVCHAAKANRGPRPARDASRCEAASESRKTKDGCSNVILEDIAQLKVAATTLCPFSCSARNSLVTSPQLSFPVAGSTKFLHDIATWLCCCVYLPAQAIAGWASLSTLQQHARLYNTQPVIACASR